ncbi:hypothetical protein ACFYRI_27790 [Streptomyces microflavus]
MENGVMPPSYFAPLLGAHRQAHARRAVTAVWVCSVSDHTVRRIV